MSRYSETCACSRERPNATRNAFFSLLHGAAFVASLVALLMVGNIVRESSSSSVFFWLLSAFNIIAIFSSNLAIVSNKSTFVLGILGFQMLVNLFALIYVKVNDNYHLFTATDTAFYVVSICLTVLAAICGTVVAHIE